MDGKGSNKKVFIAAVVMVVLMAAAGAAYLVFAPKTSKGSKKITVTVIDNKGEKKEYKHKTDAEYLLDAIKEIEELEVKGVEGEYGLYVESVNGLSADYVSDGAYWSLYINDEYANLAIDKQPVQDGETYMIKYEVWSE